MITVADIEQQIAELMQAAAELRAEALELEEFRAKSGAEARQWLIRHGATEKEAVDAIVAVIRENRARRAG